MSKNILNLYKKYSNLNPKIIISMENLKLAGFGKRFVAYIIDAIVLGIAMSIIFIPFGGVLGFMGMNAFQNDGDMTESETIATAAMAGISIGGIVLIALVVPFVYDALMTASEKQGTIGKMVMKIKVIKENGEKLNTTDAFVRSIVKYAVGSFCALLFLICLTNKQEQNLHDMASKSLVVEY
jgi:uncharacterized RDD family membrane protein YckC